MDIREIGLVVFPLHCFCRLEVWGHHVDTFRICNFVIGGPSFPSLVFTTCLYRGHNFYTTLMLLLDFFVWFWRILREDTFLHKKTWPSLASRHMLSIINKYVCCGRVCFFIYYQNSLPDCKYCTYWHGSCVGLASQNVLQHQDGWISVLVPENIAH